MATTNSAPRRLLGRLVATGLLGLGVPCLAASVFLEDMTTVEVQDRLAAGTTVVIVPIGGTEQNGPHMVLGKHNVRVRVLAGLIADQLGSALVAPVLAYVPEGSVQPRQGHMRYPGTISIPERAFEAVVAGAVDSLCAHGFRHVVLIGDHGGYQHNLDRVAGRRGLPTNCKAHAVTEFYRAAQQPFAARLSALGYRPQEIGVHAGLADTALSLAIEPGLVRPGQMAANSDGVQGDPRRATAALGREGVALIVEQSVRSIRNRIDGR